MTNVQWTRWQEFLTLQDGISQAEFANFAPNVWKNFFATWWDYVIHGLEDGREHPPHRPS